ncbi:MAG: nucleotide triphosphate diphosphatase NUDT15 [Desulfatibacillaceae bacterium]
MLFTWCPLCAERLESFHDEDAARMRCPACGWVQYRNPTVGAAVIVLDGRNILLARRKGSYTGSWCIPCGHVEWDEDVRVSAAREFFEETGIVVDVGPVFDAHSNFHDPDRRTVGIWFLGTVAGGELRPGSDVSEVAWFSLDAPPLDLAFPTDRLVLDRLARETLS